MYGPMDDMMEDGWERDDNMMDSDDDMMDSDDNMMDSVTDGGAIIE